MRSKFAFGVLIGSLVLHSGAHATVLLESTPRDLAVRAGVIFAGTVTRKFPEYQGRGGTVVTRYTFRELVFAKGASRRDSLVLVMKGADTGPMKLIVDGQPTMEVGERYIILSYKDLGSRNNSYMPIAGLHQGIFRVTPSSTGGDKFVGDIVGNPIVAAAPNRITLIAGGLSSPRSQPSAVMTGPQLGTRRFLSTEEDPGTRMTEKDFLNFLSGLH